MLKQEYAWLDGSEDAKLVASHTRDLFEYLAGLQAAGALDTRFERPIGAVTYHVPCHLRAQNIGTKSADVLRAVPGAQVTVVERCSAVDGTWGFKTEYFDLSLKVAKPLFDAVTGRREGHRRDGLPAGGACRSPRAPARKPAIPSRSWPRPTGCEDA